MADPRAIRPAATIEQLTVERDWLLAEADDDTRARFFAARREEAAVADSPVEDWEWRQEPRGGSVVPDTRTAPAAPGSGDEGYTIAGLLATTRETWAHRRLTPEQVVTLASVVVGDLARAVRDRTSEADLKRELGNLMLALEWAAALGFDPGDCIEAALPAQALAAARAEVSSCSGTGTPIEVQDQHRQEAAGA